MFGATNQLLGALALLSPPGDWGELGADIACGEGQSMGIPQSFGGPGLGMFAAVELVRDKGSRERLAPNSEGAVFCRDTANANGLMVRQTGDAMITAPPLISSTAEIDILVEKLAGALDQDTRDLALELLSRIEGLDEVLGDEDAVWELAPYGARL